VSRIKHITQIPDINQTLDSAAGFLNKKSQLCTEVTV